ncbi:MAG: NAD(P)-dependent oxidoreductase [Xanthobacteraceae bacterium]|nr:NAD(P)-dependent oxidoreductase [Xanthobacteraceae bacterium]PWB59863.1 MAG: 6-phosphogluconate dehydrogenase [Bradyrhizobiaceae bacterium]
MADNTQRIGWIGMGRMGYPMAERLLKAGHDVAIWNRTRAKAEPLAAVGGKVVDKLADLADVDVVFSIVSTGKDLDEVYFGANGVAAARDGRLPKIFVDCSTISVEDSAAIRRKLADQGADFIACPVSGNAKVIKAGRLSAVASGPEAAFRRVQALVEVFAPNGVAHVGEGELARICKIAHNVMLGVVIENLIEITLLAEKAGVPRHAFLAFMNNSVMGSMFTRYKAPALVNLDWTTTFTPELLRKDLDLGLELGRELDVPMPVTAATREVLQAHFGAAQLKPDPEGYLQKDFAALLETMAIGAGVKLESENKQVPTGLEG